LKKQTFLDEINFFFVFFVNSGSFRRKKEEKNENENENDGHKFLTVFYGKKWSLTCTLKNNMVGFFPILLRYQT
jgi:hypothetical protein